MGKIRSLGLGVLLAGAIIVPSAARASSCSIATVAGQPGGCIYKATGAGQYRAITTSGWQISISRAGAPFQIVLAARQVSCLAPPANAVSQGTIPSLAGDLVKLEVRIACFQLSTPGGKVPPSVLKYENGFIAGGDGAAAGVPEPPSTAHGDPSNSCVARDVAIVTTGSMTCSYTAAYASGQVIQATPNHIDITYTDADGVHTVYHQGSASLPGRGTFSQPIGATMVVTVGPDTASGPVAGSVGIVIAGDF